MRILFIGDLVGQRAAAKLAEFLPGYKRRESIDVIIVNGENSADGNGITPTSAGLLLQFADVITTGNHCFQRREADELYVRNANIIRPANFGGNAPGSGVCVLEYPGYSLTVVNIIGNVFMAGAANAFKAADALLSEIANTSASKNIFIDFHAEATSEKKAFGYYLAGRVSAVIGTHTHVQTADEAILDNHTAYITDAGMSGAEDSVLGLEKKALLDRFADYYPYKVSPAAGRVSMCGVIVSIDTATGASTGIARVNEYIAD